jgi:hypothetical protein
MDFRGYHMTFKFFKWGGVFSGPLNLNHWAVQPNTANRRKTMPTLLDVSGKLEYEASKLT